MANLEEGELEDGELLSSDEDGEGETTSSEKESPSKETVKSETVSESVVIPKLLDLDTSMPLSDSKTNHASAHSPDQDAKASLNEEASGEEGEIFSDDEEAAYYPQHVRSRAPPPSESNWKPSDAEKSDNKSPSAVHSGRSLRDRERERERNRQSSSESESDSISYSHYDTKERGLFFEDRDGSGSESTGSRDRMRSRSRERERDHHTSPKYGRNRNRDRDRSSNRSRNDDDSNDHGSHYGRQVGGYGRTKGGYGGYQQRGGYGSSKFQVGGYSSSVQPGLMNTGMTAQQCHHLASKVKKRREDGLPLLPQPNLEKCGNLDQYNYPAQPSWYLEEVENWEKKEKEEEERKKAEEETNSEEKVEQVETKADESKPAVEERKRPISPLFRRTSSVALEIVSSPVSDGESPMVVADLESEATDSETSKDLIAPPESNEQSCDSLETTTETMPSTVSAPLSANVNDTSSIKSLKELAANVVQASNESTTTITATVVTTTMATTSIATTDIATTDTATTSLTTSMATTTTTTTATANSTATSTKATPQSPLDPSSSTSDSSSLTHTTNSPTLPPLTLAPLTITNESTATKSDDGDHSPSLSPTIPIQSGSQLKRTVSKPSPKFMPKIMSDSESEGDYDDYLDQLDQEEDDVDVKSGMSLLANTLNEGFPLISGSSAPSLTSLFETGDKTEAATNQILKSSDDPFSEDFPSIGKETKKSSSNQPSLMSLIGQEITRDQSVEKKTSKSYRRKQKDIAWWTKQKEREKKKVPVVVTEDLKKAMRCKYFINGNCKHGDNCSYSHDCEVEKKKEICKFYIQGYCNKGQLCNYYHETFPCKYFHTKGYCNNGDQCRFSHAPLTLDTKELLISVLEPAQVAALNTSLLANLLEPSSAFGSLVVSIPKDIVKGLIVSIPLSKLRQGIKHPPTNKPPASMGIPSGPLPPPQQHQNQPTPSGPFPFQEHSAASLPGAPSQFGAPPHAPPPNQPQPIPLFPPKNQFQQPPFPPNQPPGPPHPPIPHPPHHLPPHGGPQGQAKKALLPTPPPHMMLVPDDLKRMESHLHDYWEAPELTQQNTPAPYNNAYPQQHPPPPPSVGGAPPQPFNGPPQNQFAQGGFHHQPAPPPPGAQGFPPQQPPPYRQPPPPQQFGPYHGPPCQQQPPPLFRPIGPHPPQWTEHQGDGTGMRQQPGMEQRPPPPHGMDPRQNQAGPPPSTFPPSRVDPRQQPPPPQGGGMAQPGWNSDPRRTDVVEPIGRPTPSNQSHPPPPYEQQQQRSWQQEGGWNPPPQARAHSGPGGPAGGAPYHRHNGGPPPFGSAPHPNPNMPPSGAPGVAPFHQPPPMAPYQHHNTAPGMSPPHATKYPMPPQQVGGAGQTQAPPPMKDKLSPAWGTSPEYSGSQSPGTGGGGVSPAGDQIRRRDPRTKYAHLKIKSKSGQHSTLKRSVDEAGMESSASGFKIPKLLQDSSALNQLMDPGELFGSKDALSGGEEKDYGLAITAPFGAFRSMFAPSQPSDTQESGADSAGSTQQFGEITMGASVSDPAPEKSNENEAEEKSPLDSKSEDNNTEDVSSKPSKVPSYLAHLDMGLGSDLKIDSAFGSLSEKSSNNGKSHDQGSSGQDSQARKLPSIYGFS